MRSPYQLENLTSLVNVDLVLLERKYRALPNLELCESLMDMCLVHCYDEMVTDLCGISCEDWLPTKDSIPSPLASEGLNTATNNTNSSRSDSEDIRNSPEISHFRSDSEIKDSGSLLARMRRHVTFTPDTVFEN